MTDYGHDLLFGSFLTPAAEDASRVVALAQLTDQLGLELASVQDHPYQPAHLDAWTLLSVIAASTESVRVVPNVANLPLRPPVVLARSAASLDLLSGGRVELGLGSGGFLEAAGSIGAPSLTAAESVSALEEAIRIIRGVWDADGPRVRVAGDHYRVDGARPGPAPAHDIGIWLGAYKPRMLALTGRRADGWLPTLAYAAPDVTGGMNDLIDEAAVEAGRVPSEVRRLYNVRGRFSTRGGGFLQGPPEQWAQELAELTLTQGFSAYLIGSDDPDDLRRFAGEVAPAVRELVEAGRAAAPETTGDMPATVSAMDRPVAAHTVGVADLLGVTPTPDDGVRLAKVSAWDESTRPTGPPHDPTRGYTARQSSSGQHLVDIHDHLRQELLQIRGLIEQVAAGSLDPGHARSHINTMTMRQNNWTLGTYCESYCRVVTTHHTIEDQTMLPGIRDADPRLTPVIDRLAEEHMVIHDVLEGVDRALVALVNGPGGIDALREAVNLLSDSLLSHLSYEERELVEPLARLNLMI